MQSQLRRPSNTQAETRQLLAKTRSGLLDTLAPVEYARDRGEVTAIVTPVGLNVVQKSLQPGEALIEYVLSGGKDSYAFEITSEQVRVHMLPPRDRIEKLGAGICEGRSVEKRFFATVEGFVWNGRSPGAFHAS